MRLKTLLVALLAAGLAASFAAAAPPPGRGNQGLALGTPTPVATSFGGENHSREGRPTAVVLQGEFVSASADASGAGSFLLLVERASKHGSLRGRQVTVEVDAGTRFGRRGEGELADLSEGDRLVVHARASRRAGGSALRLLARRVLVRPPAPAGR